MLNVSFMKFENKFVENKFDLYIGAFIYYW